MSSESGRKLSDLRVCDLKEELEMRNLDVSGNKNLLVERMQKALEEAGKDPNTFLFPPLDKKSSPKTPGGKKTEEETTPSLDKNVDITSEAKFNGDSNESEIGKIGNVNKKDGKTKRDNQPNDVNTNDIDESINLTIEEDEQKLLHDEAQDEKDKTTRDANQSSIKDVLADRKQDINIPPVTKDVDVKNDSEKDEKSQEEKKETEKNVAEKTKEESEQKVSKGSITKEEKEKSTGEKLLVSPPCSRNLWVSGLSSLTRASDLKTIFSKYGKVIGAKVVTNTRTPGTRCYGYVTMFSSFDATRCIEHLHCTELHGRIISVERTKNELGSATTVAQTNTSSKKKEDDKKKSPVKGTIRVKSGEELKECKDILKEKSAITTSANSSSITSSASKDKEKTSLNFDAGADNQIDKVKSDASSRKSAMIRSRSPRGAVRRRGGGAIGGNRSGRARRASFDREKARTAREREILSYQKIREERERQRLRERERALREEDRRRVEIRRRQREEEQRLAREREKLALERERLEREKAEILRLERDRQKLERERIELERLELKRQQMKIIQSSRTDDTKRPLKRTSNDRYSADRKRAVPERRFEAPPPPRFDTSMSSSYDRDKKRDEYSSNSKRDDYSSSKRDEYHSSKRDDYSSSSKLVEYPTVKRDDFPSNKRDDFSSNKRDDYSSNKRDEFSSNKRDDYKRDIEVSRHSSSSGNYHGSGRELSSSHKTSNRYSEPQGFRRNDETSFPKKKPISEVKVHRPIDFKNTMIPTIPDAASSYRNSSGSSKRYDGVSGAASNYTSERTTSSNTNWPTATLISSGGHSSHNHTATTSLKSYINNGISSSVNVPNWQPKTTEDHWRQVDTTQDRYDRTYNERSGPYIENASRTGMYVGNPRPVPDRYGGQIQRY